MKRLDMHQSLLPIYKKITRVDKEMDWGLRLRIWVQEAKETRSFVDIRRLLSTQLG